MINPEGKSLSIKPASRVLHETLRLCLIHADTDGAVYVCTWCLYMSICVCFCELLSEPVDIRLCTLLGAE